jgi:hypothetical protein
MSSQTWGSRCSMILDIFRLPSRRKKQKISFLSVWQLAFVDFHVSICDFSNFVARCQLML